MRGGVNGGRGGRGAGSTMNLREEQVGCDKDSGGLLTAEERERGIAFPWSVYRFFRESSREEVACRA